MSSPKDQENYNTELASKPFSSTWENTKLRVKRAAAPEGTVLEEDIERMCLNVWRKEFI